MSNVYEFTPPRHDLFGLIQAIKDAIYSRSGSISVAEAIGVLELAKHEIIAEQED